MCIETLYCIHSFHQDCPWCTQSILCLPFRIVLKTSSLFETHAPLHSLNLNSSLNAQKITTLFFSKRELKNTTEL